MRRRATGQADVIEPPLDAAAEDVAIETQHAIEVDDAQDEVVEAADRDGHERDDTVRVVADGRDGDGLRAARILI